MMCGWLLGRLWASRRHHHLGPQETALLTLGVECEMADDLQKRKAVPPQKMQTKLVMVAFLFRVPRREWSALGGCCATRCDHQIT